MPAIVVVDDYNVKIHENGKVTIEEDDGMGSETGGGTTGEDTPNPPIPPVSDTVVPGEIVTEKNKEYTKNGTAVIPVGFAIVPGLDDVSEGLVISDVANDTENQGNQFVWIPVADETPYERNRTYANTLVSTAASEDTGYLPDGIADEEQAVRSKKGFYIARYETGKEGTDTVVSKKGATVWVDIIPENAKTTAKTIFTENTHVKSALISGIQWDMVMEFIASKPRIDGTNRAYDVTVYDSRRHKGDSIGVEVAGNNEADKVCNIYDLEGNAFECVAEKNNYNAEYPFVVRGGVYGSSYIGPASSRDNSNGSSFSYVSFRLVLYVK